ncbi:MAG: hypothetical protein ACK54A_08370 [Sphingobacteriales bacterium]|jgi:hypothetical protein
MYILITVIFSAILLFFGFSRSRGPILLNPMAHYTFFQLLGFLGMAGAVDYELSSDVIYFWICAIGILSSAIGVVIGNSLFPIPNELITHWKRKPFWAESGMAHSQFLLFMAFFSTVVCITYFVSVGYNVFLLGVSNLLDSGTALRNVSSLRLGSYDGSTGRYHFPGYVNQFKDTLLPLCLFYLWTLYFIQHRPHKQPLGFVLLSFLTIVSLVSILGTGQRGAFVLAMVMGASFLTVVVPKNKNIINYLIVAGISVPLMAISTQINGRSQSREFSWESIMIAIWQRIISDNQWGAVIGFRLYVVDLPTQWGNEWLESILGVSPWHPGSSLASDIARVVWRGGSGTVPTSNWGSIYHNFSWFGIICFPVLYCAFLVKLQQGYYLGEKTMFRTMVYVYSYVLLGSWIAGSPFEHFLNGGVVAIVMLYFICRRLEMLFGRRYLPLTLAAKTT